MRPPKDKKPGFGVRVGKVEHERKVLGACARRAVGEKPGFGSVGLWGSVVQFGEEAAGVGEG